MGRHLRRVQVREQVARVASEGESPPPAILRLAVGISEGRGMASASDLDLRAPIRFAELFLKSESSRVTPCRPNPQLQPRTYSGDSFPLLPGTPGDASPSSRPDRLFLRGSHQDWRAKTARLVYQVWSRSRT